MITLGCLGSYDATLAAGVVEDFISARFEPPKDEGPVVVVFLPMLERP